MLRRAIMEALSRGGNIPLGNPLNPNMGAAPNPYDMGTFQPTGYQTPPYAGDRIGGVAQVVNGLQDEPDMVPEPIQQTAPAPDAGPSVAVPAASIPPHKKRGGILGTLESIFMPEPGSRWAAALRGGIWDAKANQKAYKQKEAVDDIGMQTAQAKLKALLTKGEYQIVGNNVFHIPADGGQPEIITPPTTPSETERLIEKWQNATDPVYKDLLERILAKSNAAPVIQEKGDAAAKTAEARARAAAKYRAPPRGGTVKIPTGFILD